MKNKAITNFFALVIRCGFSSGCAHLAWAALKILTSQLTKNPNVRPVIEHPHVKQPWLTRFKARLASSPIDTCVSSYQKRSTYHAEVDAALFEEKTGVSTLTTLAKATAPGALVLSKVATQIEQKTADLANKIAGDDVTTVSAKRPSAFSQRRAAKAA